MAYTVADLIVETIREAGAQRVWGIPGDSLNGFTNALRTHPELPWMHVRHEEAGAFAASGEAAMTLWPSSRKASGAVRNTTRGSANRKWNIALK